MKQWCNRLVRRGHALWNWSKVNREMDGEMRFHLDMEIEDLVRRGMDREEATRQARLAFGAVERYKEEGRDARGVRWFVDLGQDLRYAVRTMRKAPGFTAAAVITLALGIGATTAIFSVVDGVLLKPLPYPDAEQLVRIFEESGANAWPLSVADYLAIEEEQRSFQGLAGLRIGESTLVGGEYPRRIPVGFVTADWFEVLGIQTAAGRAFRPGEDRPGADLVAVVSDAFRAQQFGDGADAVGQSLTLDGQLYTIVGVLPPGVRGIAGWRADVWPVLQLGPPSRRGPFFIRAIARLKDGVEPDQAQRDLAGISARLFPRWATSFQDEDARLAPVPLRDVVVGDVGGGLALLLGAVGFVLLIAVANVANLQLARASTREREMAMRTSLGATRGRLVRQLLVESAVLAGLGGVAGLVFADLALDALIGLAPRLPRLDEVTIDGRVLAVTALVTLVSGAIFGLAPLAHGLSDSLSRALRGGGRTGSAGRRAKTLRGALVTAEFALALPLLAGAALLFASLSRLQQVDVGFEPDNLLVARASIAPARYPDPDQVQRFWRRALPELAGIPGVSAVGLSSAAPPDNPGLTNNFDLLDRPVAPGTTQPSVPWVIASPGLFEALGVPLLRGRLPDESDDLGDPPVVAVSQAWAARFFPGEDVLGRQLYSGGDRTTPVTIVGVVGDVKYLGLDGADQSVVYQCYTQAPWPQVHFIIRSRGPSVTAGELRNRLMKLDAEVPLTDVQTMRARLSASVDLPRYWSLLVGMFACVGVLLAAVGIYGVLSYHVGRQSRDIGIRIALGAELSHVRGMVVRQGMRQAALGLVFGLAAALSMTRWLGGLLFEVSSTDPLTLAGVSGLLLAVALVASYGPARRATRVDPVRVLSED